MKDDPSAVLPGKRKSMPDAVTMEHALGDVAEPGEDRRGLEPALPLNLGAWQNTPAL